MTRHGRPIETYPLRNQLNTGLHYGKFFAKLVSPFEEREAARFNLYNWGAWRAMDPGERVIAIAYYRLSHTVEAHRQDAMSIEIERRNRLKGGPNGTP